MEKIIVPSALSNLWTERRQLVLIFILIKYFSTREPMRSNQLETFYTRVVCGSQQQLQLEVLLVQSTILKYRPAIKPHSQRTIDVWIRGVVVQLKDQVATTFASRPVILLEPLLAASTDHTVSWIFHRARFTFKIGQKKKTIASTALIQTPLSFPWGMHKARCLIEKTKLLTTYSDGLRCQTPY